MKHLKVTFVGEPAVDAGGPLREYFHLLLREHLLKIVLSLWSIYVSSRAGAGLT